MEVNIVECFEEVEKKYPDKIAFWDENGSISFSELRRKAMILASEINARLFNVVNEPIAVYAKKGIESIIAFLGIIYSGNFYTPIDTKMPKDRVELILETLKPKGIVYGTTEKRLIQRDEMTFFFDETECECQGPLGYKRVCDVDPMYVLFTSGSTGVPKGVVISHKSVLDYIEWIKRTFSFGENTILGNQAPFYFDNSVLDIYTAICLGCTTVIIPEMLFMFPEKNLQYMKEKKINTIFWVPSAIISLANASAFNNIELSELKKVLFCGEVMPNKYLNIWRKRYPQITYANLYGPTEITDVCTYYVVDREFLDDEPLPIGKPCENTDVIVLNEKNEAVTQGELGELCIRGIGVGLGYYQDIEKTQNAFVQNPLNSRYRDIIYRTGDLVRYNKRNEIEYICRKDFQIKHQGYRIELGEIETVVAAFDGVLQCCVLYNEVRMQIILFVTVQHDLTEKNIYQYMKKKLPLYMLPEKIIILNQFPLNMSGKIDRGALKSKWIG